MLLRTRIVIRRGWTQLQQLLPAGAFLLVIALAWEWAVAGFDVPKWLLPAPSHIIIAFYESGPVMMRLHSRITLIETGLGLALSVTCGLIVGGLVHAFTPVRQMLYPLLVASQTIPIIVLAPLLVIWFGYGLLPKLLLVTIACFFPVAISVVDGLDRASPSKLKLLRSLGATNRQQLLLVKIPEAAPTFFTGLRVAATYAVMAAVVSEWMGSDAGLGVFILRSAHSFRTERVFAGMLLVTLYSIVCFALVGLIRRLALPWEQHVVEARGGGDNVRSTTGYDVTATK